MPRTAAPWDNLERRTNESAIDFAERRVETLGRWSSTYAAELRSIADNTRALHLAGEPETAHGFFQTATANLYRRFSA